MGEKLLYNTVEPMKPLIDVGLRKRRLCISKKLLANDNLSQRHKHRVCNANNDKLGI